MFSTLNRFPQNYAVARVTIIPHLKADRYKDKLERTIGELESIQKDFFGDVSNYEVLQPNTFGKLYFDREIYLKNTPSAQEIEEVLAESIRHIKRMMELVDFFEPLEEIAVSESHGYVIKDKEQVFKVSFHLILINYKINLSNGFQIIEHFKDLFPREEGWDHSVYPRSGERLMRLVGSYKTPAERKRVLKPSECRLTGSKPFHNHVISYLTGNENDLMEVLGLEKRASHHASTSRRASITPMTDQLPPDWMTLKTGALRLEAVKALQEHGLVEGFEATKIKYEEENVSVYFENNGGRECLTGPHVHQNNNFVVNFKPDGRITYFCFSQKTGCNKHLDIGKWKANASHLFSFNSLSAAELRKFTPHVVHRARDAMENIENPERYAKLYQAFVLQYMDRFFCVVAGTSAEVVQEYYDTEGKVTEYVRRKVKDTQLLLGNAADAWKIWWNHPERREKERFGYYANPAACPDSTYNLFHNTFNFINWPTDPLSEDELLQLEPILSAFRVQLSEDNDGQFNYNMNWFAHKVQYPYKKIGIMPWFCGPQGSGKGVLLDRFIGKGLFGAAYLQVSSLSLIMQKFNSVLLGKVLVMVDDAELDGTKRTQTESLKAIITEPQLVLRIPGAVVFKARMNLKSYAVILLHLD